MNGECMTWQDFKRIVDEKLKAINVPETCEIGYIDFSYPDPGGENITITVNKHGDLEIG